MPDDKRAITLGDYVTLREALGRGVFLFSQSDVTEVGNYIPPGEIYLDVKGILKLVDTLLAWRPEETSAITERVAQSVYSYWKYMPGHEEDDFPTYGTILALVQQGLSNEAEVQ
jgi:hypothetical protein